jgi:hypothetical protein
VELNDPARLSDGNVPEGSTKFTIYLTSLTTHECKRFLIVSLGNQYYCFLVRGLVWFRRYTPKVQKNSLPPSSGCRIDVP